ncbi:MAG: Gfo/Idh/MocA family oxidoreductase [Novosphingobium sp.]|nr:Gfo/Idh/MocA family oxidoreductase [Novosphingobium sp.]
MTQAESSAPRAIVVGTGFGCRIQLPALRGAGFKVVGLVGTDAGRTAERAAINGVPNTFTDLPKAIAETGADLVAISTPPHTHAELSILALEAGCHVLAEKPFARDAAEAHAMLEAAEKASKVHMIGNEFRYVPQRSAIARAIANGMIGEVRFASFIQYISFLTDFAEVFPDWWFDPAQGGGWLGASGSHLVDQVRSWLGEFDTVSASLGSVTMQRGPVEDSFSVHFRLKNGTEGILQQTSGAFGPMTEMTRVAGSEGTLWMDGETIRIADKDGERELPVPPDLVLAEPPALTEDPRQARPDWQAMAYAEIAPYTELAKTLLAAMQGKPSPSPVPPASFSDGVANMQVMDAIRSSAANGGAMVKVAGN